MNYQSFYFADTEIISIFVHSYSTVKKIREPTTGSLNAGYLCDHCKEHMEEVEDALEEGSDLIKEAFLNGS